MTLIVLALAIAVVVAWAVASVHLRGEDLSAFDRPNGERFSSGCGPSAELGAVIASLSGIGAVVGNVPRDRRIAALREYIDNAFAERVIDATFTRIDCAGVPGEWVLAPGVDGSRRTLYIHGGGFLMGSPKSHRTLTSQFSAHDRWRGARGGLPLDARALPHGRYRGLPQRLSLAVGAGPRWPGARSAVFVAGDSAGGNLTLSLIAWVRDQGLRAPDAAVALSPLTDSTLVSPSLRGNLRSDVMLGPLFGPLTKLPGPVLLWIGWFRNRINPRDPTISPVYGDLSNLPPVLVQASEVEMLLDDSRRYVNRARAAGSPVSCRPGTT